MFETRVGKERAAGRTRDATDSEAVQTLKERKADAARLMICMQHLDTSKGICLAPLISTNFLSTRDRGHILHLDTLDHIQPQFEFPIQQRRTFKLLLNGFFSLLFVYLYSVSKTAHESISQQKWVPIFTL